MSSLSLSLIVFACIFGGALFGLTLRKLLPGHHLSNESKDTVKLSAGLMGTMGALVLGLLVGSAKASYDVKRSEVMELAANAILLDRVLHHIGPSAQEARTTLKHAIGEAISQLWGGGQIFEGPRPGEQLYDQIHALSPASDGQKASIAEAQSALAALARTRLLLYSQGATSIATPLLIVMVFWLSAVFTSFGLFAPPNLTVVAALMASALSVSAAIFLVLEMDRPFAGIIQISSEPLRAAEMQMGK
ncbi:MAG: DUF4239 domain-containing protein [Phycisphaerales bacterium]|nr:DUF4239 domain-containing protein [Planctomycetota bacterium]